MPIPLSLTLLKGTNTAAAASIPTIGTAAVTATAGGGGAVAAGGLAGSAIALKAAAVVAAVGVAGGVGYTGAKDRRKGNRLATLAGCAADRPARPGEGRGRRPSRLARPRHAVHQCVPARTWRKDCVAFCQRAGAAQASGDTSHEPEGEAGTGVAAGKAKQPANPVRENAPPRGQSQTKPKPAATTTVKRPATPPGQAKQTPQRPARSTTVDPPTGGKKPPAKPERAH